MAFFGRIAVFNIPDRVKLAADNGLYARFFHRLDERINAVHIAVIGNRAGGHSFCFQRFGKGGFFPFARDSCRAVKQAVFGMQMKMDEFFTHFRSPHRLRQKVLPQSRLFF